MNYQLMFQTIAILCGIATVFTQVRLLILNVPITEATKRQKREIVFLFVTTVVSGALAAGLS